MVQAEWAKRAYPFGVYSVDKFIHLWIYIVHLKVVPYAPHYKHPNNTIFTHVCIQYKYNIVLYLCSVLTLQEIFLSVPSELKWKAWIICSDFQFKSNRTTMFNTEFLFVLLLPFLSSSVSLDDFFSSFIFCILFSFRVLFLFLFSGIFLFLFFGMPVYFVYNAREEEKTNQNDPIHTYKVPKQKLNAIQLKHTHLDSLEYCAFIVMNLMAYSYNRSRICCGKQ